jgi:diguanylate cyclase (GGDEF)-like protein
VAAVIAAVGVLATLGWALVEQSEAKQERELTFAREAEAAQQQLQARIGELSTRFDATLSFLGATHPAAAGVFSDYVEREVPLQSEVDPGVIFLEQVERSELAALEQREHELGVTDFEVDSSDLYPDFLPALVVTRARQNHDGSTLPYLGLDVTAGFQLLLPESFPDEGYVMRVTGSSGVLSSALTAGGGADLAATEDLIPEVTPFYVGEARDADGQRLGWAIQFVDPDVLVDGVTLSDQMNARLSVAGIDDPIVALSGSQEPDPLSKNLYEEHQIVTAAQPWSLEIWAGPDLGPPTGLFAQTGPWALGLAISGGLSLAGWAVAHLRRGLAGAGFELEHARTLATTDQLTGLLNRQGLIDAVGRRSPDEEATVYFIDLDGFRSVNDERGHEAGDTVLAAVAEVLGNSFRQTDLVCRLGGDEFVVYTPGQARNDSAQIVADKVVDRISSVDPSISCSLGIAHRPAGAQTDVKVLLQQADEAMYEAKRNGGDRYMVGGP